jgi:hypothetical protein
MTWYKITFTKKNTKKKRLISLVSFSFFLVWKTLNNEYTDGLILIINNDFLDFQLFIRIIFFFLLPSVYPLGVLNCYSSRHHRSAMAEILHIQLKIPLHESKREKEKEKEWQSHIYIYIYTSSINHLHLRLPSSLSSNKDKLSASHSYLCSLFSSYSRISSVVFHHLLFFLWYSLCCFVNDPY